MAGTAITPAPPAGMDFSAGISLTPSSVNSLSIGAVAERLAFCLRTPHENHAVEFFHLCLSLSRGIDYAIVNNEVPGRVQDLPILLKQVSQHKNDSLLQAAIMVLIISVKNACKIGWFPAKDSEELLALANEIGSSFCSVRDLNTEPSSSLQIISTIMLRFYPQIKMGHILAFLEVKPGYGTFAIDFHVSKNAKSSAEEKIRLFVAQIDNVETSSCIISPPQVNFLLNGKGVERRTNLFMDTRPQLPTVVTHMLKYGTNLLQAVGEFNGHYVVVVAYMSVFSSSDDPVLPDYVRPVVAAPESDFEIIEGPSRISLNCPISFMRVKTPVKGHSCKHLQCFDFHNFVEINSRRPSWRCPHCNQYVCYTDICVDQNMVKVLKEVGENVSDVIMSADGSWKAVLESNGNTDQPNDKMSNCQQDGSVQQKASSFSNAPPDIMDLIEGDDDMDLDLVRTCETPDIKPILANRQSQSSVTNQTIPSGMNNANEINQNDFRSGIFLSMHGSGASSVRSNAQIIGGVSGPAPTNFRLSPVFTDAVSPALNREPEASHGNALLATSIQNSQISALSSTLQLQQSHFGNSVVSNEYGMVPSIPRYINRTTPNAVQAIPAQTPVSIPQQRTRNSFSTLTPQGPSLASQISAVPSIVDGVNATSSTSESRPQFSRSHLNPLQVSQMTSSLLQLRSTTQNSDRQDCSFISSQAAQQIVGQIVGLATPNRPRSSYRVSPVLTSEHQNSPQQQPLNSRVSPSQIWSSAHSTHFPRTQSGVGPTAVPGSSQRLVGSAQQAARADTRTDGLADLPVEQNWRPTGRMRGSLSGQAYSDALNQFIIQPTPPVQAARPPLNMTSAPPGMPSPPHVLMTNSRNGPVSRATESTNMTGGSGMSSRASTSRAAKKAKQTAPPPSLPPSWGPQPEWAKRSLHKMTNFDLSYFQDNPNTSWAVQQLQARDLLGVCSVTTPAYPRLVRLFYQNMNTQPIEPYSLFTTVDGVNISINEDSIVAALECPVSYPADSPFQPFMEHLTVPHIIQQYFPGLQGDAAYTCIRRRDLPSRLWLIDSVLYKNVIPLGHKAERRGSFVRALHGFQYGHSVSIASAIWGQMQKFYTDAVLNHTSGSAGWDLPFANLVTLLLQQQQFEIDHHEECDAVIPQFGRREWQHSMQRMPNPIVPASGGMAPPPQHVPPPVPPPPAHPMPPQGEPMYMTAAQYQAFLDSQMRLQQSVDHYHTTFHDYQQQMTAFHTDFEGHCERVQTLQTDFNAHRDQMNTFYTDFTAYQAQSHQDAHKTRSLLRALLGHFPPPLPPNQSDS